ncbi:hypothetical protein DB347_15655 [Opitutaceae bacterium EW11]|nr:hypothetical protein DB347_15655 [Opitutaceae bacterium EW11]
MNPFTWWVWGRFVVAICLSCAALGAQSARDQERENRYLEELRALRPELTDVFKRANDALDSNNVAEAISLYRQVYAGAPSFEPGMRRLGSALVYSGNRDEGLRLCRKAVELHRSSANLATLAYALAGGHSLSASSDDKREALRLLGECRVSPEGADADELTLAAQLAYGLDANDEYERSVEELTRRFPESVGAHYFAAIRAAMGEQWIRAEREIKNAGKAGLPAETVEKFLASGIRSRAFGWKLAWGGGLAFAAWILGLVLLLGIGYLLSRATLRSTENADPNLPITENERRIRRLYRVVLNAAGVYYYISLPVVLVMVLAACGGIVFFFLAIGWVPIKLTILLVIGAVVTIVAMVRSLFVKVSSEDPGRELRRAEAPALWQLVDEVARDVGTRPVDGIQITPGTDLAVYEKGSWREKMQDRATRILILGAGIMNGFEIAQFRSVLAHEYGHFSHRDTAGGDVALRVRNDMIKFYYAMVHSGQASYFNLAFHFLRIYHYIFRRISHGATRLQEVLADRVAAQTYGPTAFAGGLQHVVRRAIEFDRWANLEIDQVIKAKAPLVRLYDAADCDGTLVQKDFETAMNRPTTPDDTHPSPADRLRLVSAVRATPKNSESGEVWSLFAEPDAIKREMLARVEMQIAQFRK